MPQALETAPMHTYLVRRCCVTDSAHGLDAALTRMHQLEAQGATSARWLHSYALREPDGRFGLACVFSASSAQTLRAHARAAQLPAD